MTNNRIVFPDKLNFREVVKGLSDKNCKVKPIDSENNNADKFIVKELKKILNSMCDGGVGFRGGGKTRINDINESVMDTIIRDLRRNNTFNITIEKLAMNSFGDIRIDFPVWGETYYIEIKCTTKTEIKGDFLRCVYLSSNIRNITSDGKHIIILIVFDLEEIKRIFFPVSYTIKDLVDCNINLKIEYSASLNDVWECKGL